MDFYRPDSNGNAPAFPANSPWRSDPFWREHLQFYEHFHGDNSLGLGAADQAGWTGLLANLVLRCYKQDIADFDTGNEDQNRIQKKKKAVA